MTAGKCGFHKQDMQLCLIVNKGQRKWIVWIAPEEWFVGIQKMLYDGNFDPSCQSRRVFGQVDTSSHLTLTRGGGQGVENRLFIKPSVKEAMFWICVSLRDVNHSRPQPLSLSPSKYICIYIYTNHTRTRNNSTFVETKEWVIFL